MNLKWTSKASADLARLYEFLVPVNKPAAARTVQLLTTAPRRILEQPRIGERLDEFEPRDVRHHQTTLYPISRATGIVYIEVFTVVALPPLTTGQPASFWCRKASTYTESDFTSW